MLEQLGAVRVPQHGGQQSGTVEYPLDVLRQGQATVKSDGFLQPVGYPADGFPVFNTVRIERRLLQVLPPAGQPSLAVEGIQAAEVKQRQVVRSQTEAAEV